MLASIASRRRSTSNGSSSSTNWLAVVSSVPLRRLRPSSDVNRQYCKVRPMDAAPCPGAAARSTKKGPKLDVARCTVPNSGWNLYTNPPDEVPTGRVARFARSARDTVRLVAAAAAASRSTLPVSTEWPVTRKSNTSDTVCAEPGAGQRLASAITSASANLVGGCLNVIILVSELDAVGSHGAGECNRAPHLDPVADG